MSKFNLVFVSVCLGLFLAGCSDDTSTPPTSTDATVDVAADVVVDGSSSETSVQDSSVVDDASDASAAHCGDSTVPGC